jgi:hypothetical protein
VTDASCDQCSDLLEALWLRNAEIPTDLSRQILVYFAVARNGAALAELSVLPPRMPTSLSQKRTVMVGQVPQ